jgi:hypothetical protein
MNEILLIVHVGPAGEIIGRQAVADLPPMPFDERNPDRQDAVMCGSGEWMSAVRIFVPPGSPRAPEMVETEEP